MSLFKFICSLNEEERQHLARVCTSSTPEDSCELCITIETKIGLHTVESVKEFTGFFQRELKAEIIKLRLRAEKVEKAIEKQRERNTVLRDQYAHKALQYDSKCKDLEALKAKIAELLGFGDT